MLTSLVSLSWIMDAGVSIHWIGLVDWPEYWGLKKFSSKSEFRATMSVNEVLLKTGFV